MGQNFLIDESVLEKIIAASRLSKDDIVLEIGPGLGILTAELAKRVKQVIAVEKDKTLYRALENILGEQKINNIEMLNEDVLQISNFQFLISNQIRNSNFKIESKFKIKNYKLVANLPYYITSPVIRKFLETENKPELMILMVQKEVAQRICARPGQMSILAIAVQFYGQPEIISIVPRASFYPQPKVDSAIIKIIPKNQLPDIDIEKFFILVKAGFSSKRKFLTSNLSRELKIENCKLKILFDQVAIGQKLRAENLSVSDWLKLYEILKNYF